MSSDVGPLDETGVDSSSSGQAGESTRTTTGPGESTGMDEPSVCGVGDVVHQRLFDEGRGLGKGWNENTIGTAGARVQDGALTVSVDASASEGYWFSGSQFALPDRGSYIVEMVQPPPEGGAGLAWVAVLSGPDDLYLEYTPGSVGAVVSEDSITFNTLYSVPYADDLHRWGRVNFDRVEGTVDIQTSGDGVTWEPFFTFDTTGFDFEQMNLSIGGGDEATSNFEGTVFIVDNLYVCTSPDT